MLYIQIICKIKQYENIKNKKDIQNKTSNINIRQNRIKSKKHSIGQLVDSPTQLLSI